MDRQIVHNTTTPYHQQANGQVERYVKTFKEILKSKVIDLRMKWKRAVKATQSACNNFLENSSTKFAPHEITQDIIYKSYMNNII